jgi:hypothetical protein
VCVHLAKAHCLRNLEEEYIAILKLLASHFHLRSRTLVA